MLRCLLGYRKMISRVFKAEIQLFDFQLILERLLIKFSVN